MTKALFFDVFGTLMDWRTSIAREAKAILEPLGHSLDWPKFADAWRGEYQPSMEEVRSGKIPFSKLDVLHRRNLERILPRFAVNDLDEAVLRDLNLAWHRLDAWPDVPPGLARLRKKFLLAPVSNGNIALMANLARRKSPALGCDPRRRGRRRLQAQAPRLSRLGGCLQSRAARMHDGGGTAATSRRRCNAGSRPRMSRGPTNTAPAPARRARPCRSIMPQRASRTSRPSSAYDSPRPPPPASYPHSLTSGRSK